MASYITDSNMAGTTIRRHVGELVPLTTEQYMAWLRMAILPMDMDIHGYPTRMDRIWI